MFRKVLLYLLIFLISISGFSQDNGSDESKNPFAQGSYQWMYLLGPDFTGQLMPIQPSSVLSSMMNPSLSALNSSRTYEGNLMLLAGEGSSILVPEDAGTLKDLFGLSFNGGASIPTEFGNFNATLHFLYSHYRDLSIRPMFGASFSYANVIPGTSVALGGGLKAFFSRNLSDKTDYAVLGDFGFTALVPSERVEDFYIAASLINMGYGSLVSRDASQSFMPPFDFNFGLSFSYFRNEKAQLKFGVNAFAPTFLNLLVTPEFDFFFLDLFGLKVATTVDCLALAGKTSDASANRYGALLPSIGIYFRPARRANATGSASLGAKALSSRMWAVGAGFTVTEGEEYPALSLTESSAEESEEQETLIETNFYIDGEEMIRNKQNATFEPLPELNSGSVLHAIVIPDSECELQLLTVPLYVKKYSDLESAELLITGEDPSQPLVRLPVSLSKLAPVDYKPDWEKIGIVWDSEKNSLSTGFYSALVRGIRRNGETAETNTVRFYLDPELGFIKIFFDSVYETVLQPNKKSKNRTMELRQIGSYSEKWEYSIENEFFPEAYEGTIENGRPKTFVWDGKNRDGFLLPDGIYKYKIETVTPRGYRLEAEYNNIIIENNFREMALVFWNDTFSKRSPSFRIQAELINTSPQALKWMFVDVIDEDLKTYFHANEKEALTTGMIYFDGRDNSGNMLLPGYYRLRVVMSDDRGNIKTVISDPFTVKE